MIEALIQINFKAQKQIFSICLCITVFFALPDSISPQTLFEFRPSKKVERKTINNRSWNNWLKKYVTKAGYVYYKNSLKDIPQIDRYLKYLLSSKSSKIRGRSHRLAYLINLYNAMVAYGVLKYYPIKSVMRIKGVNFFKLSFYFNGKKITIDDLEKRIILPKFKEPLAHFALNCASYSCPPLRRTAYTGNRLKSQLIQQTRSYLKNTEFVRIEPANQTMKVIELFRWYKSDLGDPRSFYKKYISHKKDISNFSVEFIPYNWSLNGK